MKSLFDFLSEVKDHRRVQGIRVPFYAFVEMMIVSSLNGAYGIRAMSRFIDANESFFVERYSLQHGTPSYAGLRKFIDGVKFNDVSKVFAKWANQYIQKGEWIAIDGKALGSTVTNLHSSFQNFQLVVTSFSASQEIAIDCIAIENKKSNEGQAARDLIERFEGKGCVFTLDALHCQKKRSRRSWSQEMAMSFK